MMMMFSWLSLSVLCTVLFGFSTCQLVDDTGKETDELARVFHNALPDDLLPRLLVDGVKHNNMVQVMEKHGKLETSFLPLVGNQAVTSPRFATEEAVFHLKDLAFSEEAFKELGIVGAEWWYQVKNKHSGNVNFHYDKDEGFASEYNKMVYPQISTVMYLTNSGSPTLILDMITPDGNDNVPTVANRSLLSFPIKNKHLTFSGRLMHGVVSSLAKLNPHQYESEENNRITLLVNWWTRTPLAPNSTPLTKEMLAQFIDQTGTSPDWKLTHNPNRRKGDIEQGELDDSSSEYHEVELPPRETQHYKFPSSLSSPPDLVEYRFTDSQTKGGVGVLDLFDPNVLASIFDTPEPKVFLFHTNQKEATQFMLDISRGFGNQGSEKRMRFFTAGLEKSENAWKHFGISPSDAPKLAIHDTKADRRFVMQAKLNHESAYQFLSNFWTNSIPERDEL